MYTDYLNEQFPHGPSNTTHVAMRSGGHDGAEERIQANGMLYKRQAIAARRRCDIAFEVAPAVTRPRRPAFDEVHLRVANKARRYGVVCCRVRGGPMPISPQDRKSAL